MVQGVTEFTPATRNHKPAFAAPPKALPGPLSTGDPGASVHCPEVLYSRSDIDMMHFVTRKGCSRACCAHSPNLPCRRPVLGGRQPFKAEGMHHLVEGFEQESFPRFNLDSCACC